MSIDRQLGWMWAQACELLDQADRMQRGFVRYVGPSADAAVRADGGVWEPPVEMQETPAGLEVVFALPGVSPEHIDVRLEPNALTVSAIRPARLGSPDSVVRRMEIPHGRFYRRIALAGNRFRLGDTRYQNGSLEVRLVRTGDNRGQELSHGRILLPRFHHRVCASARRCDPRHRHAQRGALAGH